MVDAVSCFLLDLVALDNLSRFSEKLAPTRIYSGQLELTFLLWKSYDLITYVNRSLTCSREIVTNNSTTHYGRTILKLATKCDV